MRELKPILGLDNLKHSRFLLTVRASEANGKEEILSVSTADTVKSVKEKILGEKLSKDFASYKLILLRSRRLLEDLRTLEQEGVQDNDELVLWKKRMESNLITFKKSPLSSRGPDSATVKKLTEDLGPEVGESASSSSAGLPVLFDFFGELKRILISLTEVASLLQYVNSEERDDSDMEIDEVEIHVDKGLMKQLMEMGFSENRARKALIVNRMSPMEAMDWLLQHESDPTIDDPLTMEDIEEYLPEKRKRNRKPGQREFVPNAKALHNLQEMGFEKADVMEALKATGNYQEAALDWLLGDRSSRGSSIDEGLDSSSPMYKAIMEHPVVQLGMTNPRILHAFEDMLENPNTSTQYINDPEIGPVLLQISRIVQSFSR